MDARAQWPSTYFLLEKRPLRWTVRNLRYCGLCCSEQTFVQLRPAAVYISNIAVMSAWLGGERNADVEVVNPKLGTSGVTVCLSLWCRVR